MQSICVTTRYLLSKALKNSFSTLIEPNLRTNHLHFVSVVCGMSKDFLNTKYRIGKFGDDAYFMASTKNSDVIG